MDLSLTEILNGHWKERAIYTCEERAIPTFIDGLKPVQRHLVYSGYKNAKTSFDKVAAISSVIAKNGYHHGEASAAGALCGLAAYYSNNMPLFEGDGNFGNVLNPTPAAPRYIFAKLAPYIDALYKDNDQLKDNPDPEVTIPAYYLPIIPMVLVNGIKGIATGYATDIPPHDPLDIIDILVDMTKGKTVRNPRPQYYAFGGEVKVFPDHYELCGVYTLSGSTKLTITELPFGATSEGYEAHLRKLQEKNKIVSFVNNSRMDKFEFVVVLKRSKAWTDEEIRKTFKLNTTHTWNLTTVGLSGNGIKTWNSYSDMIQKFYDVRIVVYHERIKRKIEYHTRLDAYYKGMFQFITDMLSGKLNLQKLDENAFAELLRNTYKIPDMYIEKTMNMPVRNFTKNLLQKLLNESQSNKEQLKYYKQTNEQEEYRKDLGELKKQFKSYLEKNNK